MATFKEFDNQDIVTVPDTLDQLMDFIQNDISGSTTRRKYQLFVTGGLGPGVTSSLFQTVFDQDFTLQTANPMFDVTFGLSPNSSLVSGSVTYTDSTTGKMYFPSQSLMMREKMELYKLFAQNLLGDVTTDFQLVSGSVTSYIREPLFLCFKRLVMRDKIKRESFGLRLLQSASSLTGPGAGVKIFTDVGSSTNKELSFGGQVSTIVDSSNTSYPVGLLYLDKGIAVLDTQRVFYSGSLSGSIAAVNAGGTETFNGILNNFFVSASLDDIIDHVCSVRFSSGSQTAIAFQNETRINSTIYFCHLSADEFNYSSNPTYTDANNRIVVIDSGQEETQRSFTFITSIGGYDANDNLLWVAKLSRPVKKDSSRDFGLKVRLDF
jgi:hypothetical protein